MPSREQRQMSRREEVLNSIAPMSPTSLKRSMRLRRSIYELISILRTVPSKLKCDKHLLSKPSHSHSNLNNPFTHNNQLRKPQLNSLNKDCSSNLRSMSTSDPPRLKSSTRKRPNKK